MTRHTNAARDLAALLADASPDVAAANADALTALRAEIAADLAPLTQVKGAPQPPTEHDEQVALFAWAAANEGQHPELEMLHATPNGGYRPMATAVALKAEGVKAGYPDISLDIARGRWHGLRIELKRADHSTRPSELQLDWLGKLRAAGYRAIVCYGAAEAQQAIMAYLQQDAQAGAQ